MKPTKKYYVTVYDNDMKKICDCKNMYCRHNAKQMVLNEKQFKALQEIYKKNDILSIMKEV